jgi:hypothetical protein
MANRYVVKKKFYATGTDIEMKRAFRPPDHVWWDDVEHSNPIIFKFARYKWRPDDSVKFTESIEHFPL